MEALDLFTPFLEITFTIQDKTRQMENLVKTKKKL